MAGRSRPRKFYVGLTNSGARKLRPSGHFEPLTLRATVLCLLGAVAPSKTAGGAQLASPIILPLDVEYSQRATSRNVTSLPEITFGKPYNAVAWSASVLCPFHSGNLSKSAKSADKPPSCGTGSVIHWGITQ